MSSNLKVNNILPSTGANIGLGTASGTLNVDGGCKVQVGTALTLGHTQGVQFHTQNLHSTGFEVNQINASGIVTSSTQINVGSNIKLGSAGVVTATSFVGSGANLTGIDATSIKHTDGDVKAQATATGVNITGNLGVGNTTTAGRNAGVSTATGSIIYNTNLNALQVYTGSAWNVINTKSPNFGINYLVIGGGGGGGGSFRGGGGAAGALRTNWNNESQGGGTACAAAKTISIGTALSVIVGAAGTGVLHTTGTKGSASTFDDIVSKGGGGGGRYNTTDGTEDGTYEADPGGGSGGGGGGGQNTSGRGYGAASGTYGNNGGDGSSNSSQQCGGGGGGAGGSGHAGGNSGTSGDGGSSLANTITGGTVAYAGGGGGGNYEGGNTTIGGGGGAAAGGRGSGTNGPNASIANRGSGGGGAGAGTGGNGSTGVIILRFSSDYTATVSGGVTSSTSSLSGGDTLLTITATSDSSQTVTFA